MKKFIWSPVDGDNMVMEAESLDKALENISLMAEAEGIGNVVVPMKNPQGYWNVYAGDSDGIPGQGSCPYGYIWEA